MTPVMSVPSSEPGKFGMAMGIGAVRARSTVISGCWLPWPTPCAAAGAKAPASGVATMPAAMRLRRPSDTGCMWESPITDGT